MRQSGIEIVGEVPWGTHLCLLYETSADLLEAVVSYLKAGLENNELCLWVVSPDVGKDGATAFLAQAAPGLETYLQSRQLEVVPHSQVYIKGGSLDQAHALQQWQRRLDEALGQGFEGLRVTGDFAWLEPKDWGKLVAYEVAVAEVVGDSPMLALCTYPLARCSPSDVFDVMQAHGMSVVKCQGAWRVIGDVAARRQIEAELREHEAHMASILRTVSMGIAVVSLDGTQILVNESMCRLTGFICRELEGQRPPFPYWDPDNLETIQRTFQETLAGAATGKSFELPFRRKDGQKFIAQVDISDFTDAQGQRIAFLATVQDITERKNIEAELRRHNMELAWLLEASRAVTSSLDLDQVLEVILANLRQVIPAADYEVISLYDEKEGLLKARQRMAVSLEAREEPQLAIRPGEGITGKTFQSGEARLYAMPQEVAEAQANISPGNWSLFLQGTGGRRPSSSIAIPIKSRDSTIGCLLLHTFGQRVFTLHEFELAQAFANHAAVAISNARLHEELRHHGAELTSLLESSRAVVSSLDLHRVLGTIVDNLRWVIPQAEAQAIALYDETEMVLKTRLASGYEPGAVALLAIRPGESITGQAFQTGEARLYATPQEVAKAQASLSPENMALFLQATGGRRPSSSIAVPLKSGGRTLGCMLLHNFGQHTFTPHELELAQVFADDAAVAISNATLHAEMEQKALTDSLTGLYNRSHFYERLREEIARHSRDRQPLCIAMLDVDNLKIYNDTHGHQAGDRALQAIAGALRAAVRQSDIAFRYGGDEFCLILVNTSGEVAQGVVDRIKARVASELAASRMEGGAKLRLSAGVAAFGPGGWDETELVEAADKALYRSKASGGITVLYGRGGDNKINRTLT